MSFPQKVNPEQVIQKEVNLEQVIPKEFISGSQWTSDISSASSGCSFEVQHRSQEMDRE